MRLVFWLTLEMKGSKNKHVGLLINNNNLSHKQKGFLYGSV
jgi:hypothetical protein